jgi:hypothetical protein
MGNLRTGSYRDLIAKEFRGNEQPYAPPEPMTPETLKFYATEFSRIRQQLGTTVDEILAKGESNNWLEVFVTLCTFAGWKHAHGLAISDTETMVNAYYWFKVEINNGGLHQYFFNSAGDYWPYVMMALDECDDTDGIERFAHVLGIFPDSKPEIDRGKRWDQLDQMREKDEDGMWAHFGRNTDVYYDHPYPSEAKFVSMILRRKSDIVLVWPN